MTLLSQLKRRLVKRPVNDEVDLKGNDILFEMLKDKGPVQAQVDKGHEEKAKLSLETLYTPETIDIQSIRPLSGPKAEPVQIPESKELQLELNLGNRFCSSPPLFAKNINFNNNEGTKKQWVQILETYVVPWVIRRSGFATFEEVEERLERVSPGFHIPKDFREFIKLSFIEVESDLYAIDLSIKDQIQRVIQKACTYFYQHSIHYPLYQLTHWIEKEFALKWENYPQDFIEKCLSLSSCFTIYRHSSHERFVRLN